MAKFTSTDKILHVTASFYPAVEFGGPIFSTMAICDVLVESPNYSLEVLSLNYESPRKNSYLNLSSEYVRVVTEKYNIKWIDARQLFTFWRLAIALIKSFRGSTVVHLTGLFNIHIILCLFLNVFFRKKIVISARGALQALSEYKKVKNSSIKKFYISILNLLINRTKTFWLATTEREKNINQSYINITSFVIPNSVDVENTSFREDSVKSRIGFISRLSPKKNVEFFLSVCKELPEQNFEIIVAGSGDLDLEYFVKETCEAASNFNYLGQVRGDLKKVFYQQCDVLFLPSKSENFGIVIAEALSNGCSVLTSVESPWSEYAEPGILSILHPNDTDNVDKALSLLLKLVKERYAANDPEIRANSIIKDNFSHSVIKSEILLVYRKLCL